MPGDNSEEQKQDKSKKPPSAYLLYTKVAREEIKAKTPDISNKDIMKKCGEQWKALSENEKKTYKDQYKVLKDEYAQEHKNDEVNKSNRKAPKVKKIVASKSPNNKKPLKK
ncbi:hypothetical protein SteCoe_25602 [Stentor coeruleus]|uniref:HMG box domain-containing protein n=1 Tax=Stentor coeruleus TaxID=5963 RepID=A0A1R2BEU1_9CILI|nr:hypothetical protein SteCoe_25602 [Stentor coeruleus]